MQSLWSRTLRATKCTCRCRQCLSYSTAVARRSTTAFRERLSAIPSSTIFYSAIFACATFVDGRSKEQRRQKWDHAIRETKAELDRLDAGRRKAQQASDGEERPDEAVPPDEVDSRLLADDIAMLGFETKDAVDLADMLKNAVVDIDDPALAEAVMREKLRKARKRQYEKLEQQWADLDEDGYIAMTEAEAEWWDAQRYTMLDSGKPQWPENTGPEFDPRYFAPQSLYATDERKMEGLESRWTRRKIQTMNLSMAKLVLRMIRIAELHRYPLRRSFDKEADECWLPDVILHIAMKKEKYKDNFMLSIQDFIRRTKYPRTEDRIPEIKPIFGKHPFYVQDPDGEFHRECHAMNQRIFSNFERCFRRELNIPTLIGTICEELLVSPAPPNITTYNALMLGFNRLRQHDICAAVIDSMMEVHMRPDEITCAAALTHHLITNDSHGFTRFLQLMTGLTTDSYALMLARPTLNLHHATTLHKIQNRVIPHPRNPGRLVQKVHPTPRVMNGIVAGLLKFHGFDRAVDICTTLAADGWGFDTAALTRFLHACAERRDWDAGAAVWRQIQELRAQRLRAQAGRAAFPSSFPDEGDTGDDGSGLRPFDRAAYLHMLALCWRCDRKDVFVRVLEEADSVGGYRAGALEKDFEKMRRRGLDVFDLAEERRQEFVLRGDMAAKLEAEGKVVERLLRVGGLREKGRGAGGLKEGEEGGVRDGSAAVASSSPSPSPSPTSSSSTRPPRPFPSDPFSSTYPLPSSSTPAPPPSDPISSEYALPTSPASPPLDASRSHTHRRARSGPSTQPDTAADSAANSAADAAADSRATIEILNDKELSELYGRTVKQPSSSSSSSSPLPPDSLSSSSPLPSDSLASSSSSSSPSATGSATRIKKTSSIRRAAERKK